MTLILQKTYLTPHEYLTIERKAERKSEFFNGEMFLMAGASPRHVLIVTNVVYELRQQLKKRPCTVYSANLRLKVSSTGLYTYPDVIVVCGKPQFDDEQEDTLLNPTLIVEVLSESTAYYDRGKTFERYRTIQTLREYILIAQDKHHVEQYVFQPENLWIMSKTNGPDASVHLSSIGCNLAMDEVYDKVEM
ncbi:MAG TPA: Uma2 family endonuclease [Thermodesulfovibrionia bacterium]|nr:Uma2 family endonuclease [Thermodesulfovibrionia bacterium]